MSNFMKSPGCVCFSSHSLHIPFESNNMKSTSIPSLKKRFLKFSLLALLFFGLIIGWLGFGEHGFIHLYRMEEERQAYVEKIRELERKNQELLKEIHLLRNDKEYIESLARRELGLIKDNEILYRFVLKGGPAAADNKVRKKIP